MRTLAYALIALSVLWTIVTLIVLTADRLAQRRYELMLETRAWTEKVDAMRRLHDREGEV